MFVQRDFNMSEEHDYLYNVSPKILPNHHVIIQFDCEGAVIGWNIYPLEL
jgi:hypothetical protein